MKLKTITAKKASIQKSREANYRESLRLEGFSAVAPLHGKTKAEVIQYYSQKGND